MSSSQKSNAYAWPDAHGRFGDYGGRYVAETLMPLVLELDRAYQAAKADAAFQAEWRLWEACPRADFVATVAVRVPIFPNTPPEGAGTEGTVVASSGEDPVH